MADEKDRAKTGLAVGAGSLIGAAIAILASRKAEAKPAEGLVSLDEAAMNLLLAIAESGEAIDDNTLETINAINRLAAALGVTVLENPSEITSFRVLVPVVNTPVNLPDRVIPYGEHLVVKALPPNMGIVYTANSRPEALNINSCYQLLANEAIEYKVKNANTVWLNVTRAGEGVCCTVEQKGAGG